MRKTWIGRLSLCLLFVLSACDQGGDAQREGERPPPAAVPSALPLSEANVAIRAVKEAIAEDRLGRAEELLKRLERRADTLSGELRAELERLAVMVATEKELQDVPRAD